MSELNSHRKDLDPNVIDTATPIGTWVKPITSIPATDPSHQSVVMLGCPDDTGVLLGKGRPGAKLGPDSIRKQLYQLMPPMHLEWEKFLNFYDLGNCRVEKDIIETHAHCQALSTAIAQAGHTMVLLGGGHDFSAPGITGLVNGLGGESENEFGIINIDPHLNLHDWVDGKPSNLTPFRTLLDTGKLNGERFIEFGMRGNQNLRSNYEYAKMKGVSVRSLESIRRGMESCLDEFRGHLTQLSQNCKAVGLCIDLDSCSEAEGSSRAPVLGFRADELCEMAWVAGTTTNVRYLEICEVAPELDPSQRSARIAAEIAYHFLHARAKTTADGGFAQP